MSGECCKSGYNWSATPVGTEQTIHGLPSYVTKSKNATGKNVLVFFTDIWSWRLTNSRVLADAFADASDDLIVYMPDLFEGELLEPDVMEDEEKRKNFDLMAFIGRHPPDRVCPMIGSYLEAIRKTDNPQTVGGVGYCYGALGAIVFAGAGPKNSTGKALLDYTICAHPSLMSPADIEAISKPILFLVPEHDFAFTQELVDVTKKNFADASPDQYKYVHFDGLQHGFAVRGDLRDPAQLKGMEKARDEAIAWIAKNTASPVAKV